MRITKYFNSENALIFSGVLVTAFAGGLAVLAMSDSEVVILVAALAIAQLSCFIIFLSVTNRKKQVTLFWTQAVIITVLYFLVDDTFIMALSIVWIVEAAELFGSKRSSWLLVGSLIVFVVALYYHNLNMTFINIVVNVAMMALLQVFALGAVLRSIRERKLREETGALNRELIATRELLSQTSAQSERVRIARDLHDILGHHMTALILNLEVANHSVRGKDPEKAQEKVEESLAVAKLLLGDIRSAVSELREDDAIDLQQSISKLITNIPELAVEVNFDEAPVIRDVQLAETILRCTQEAITNVLRHGEATQCNISLKFADGNCVLSVSDNGKSNTEVKAGNGLTGMMERVNSIGGKLSWQHSNVGFSLLAELPLESSQ